jgi:NADH-quinone oxidoreductase subunit J
MVTAVFYASVVVGVISAVLAVSHRNPVVMLLNAPEVPQTSEARPFQRFAGALLVAAAMVGGIAVLAHLRVPVPAASASGSAHAIGRLLVGPYVFSFELVSVVLLAALVGALVLVKRKH